MDKKKLLEKLADVERAVMSLRIAISSGLDIPEMHDLTAEYWNAKIVCEHFGINRVTLGRWVDTGVLPAPIYYQTRRYWLRKDIEKVGQIKHQHKQKRTS